MEILQLIFLHSLEINLPRASPHLGRALSSPMLYTWLIRLAFSSKNGSSREGLFTPDFLPPPVDFWRLSLEQRQHLQTNLLACRWFTLPLLRRCQREYVAHVSRRKCADFVLHPDDRTLLSNLDPHFDNLTNCNQAPAWWRLEGDLVFQAQLKDSDERIPRSRTFDRKVAIWCFFGAVEIRGPTDVYYEADLFRLPSSERIMPGRIPDKLLRAPWSDDQFEFLQLLSLDFYLDEVEHLHERSTIITSRLIRKRQIEPFTRLLRMSFRAANCRVPAPWPLQPEHYALIRRCAVGPGDPFATLVVGERWEDIPPREKQELWRLGGRAPR